MSEEEIFRQICAMSEEEQKEIRNYISQQDKAYRYYTITTLLDGLERGNQDKAIMFMTKMLQEQKKKKHCIA